MVLTRADIETKLIEGFRSLKGGHPCMSRGPMLVEGYAPTPAIALNWVAEYVPDRTEAFTLLSWVRCRAKNESWRAYCDGMRWAKRTADRIRAIACERIAQGLAQVA